MAFSSAAADGFALVVGEDGVFAGDVGEGAFDGAEDEDAFELGHAGAGDAGDEELVDGGRDEAEGEGFEGGGEGCSNSSRVRLRLVSWAARRSRRSLSCRQACWWIWASFGVVVVCGFGDEGGDAGFDVEAREEGFEAGDVGGDFVGLVWVGGELDPIAEVGEGLGADGVGDAEAFEVGGRGGADVFFELVGGGPLPGVSHVTWEMPWARM